MLRNLIATGTLGFVAVLVPGALVSEPFETPELIGIWGDDISCAGKPLIEGGSRSSATVEIKPGWIRNGEVWCLMDWSAPQHREEGFFINAHARCGEDAQRAWSLGFAFQRGTDASEDELILLWGDTLIQGQYRRCNR
ncbi:hypothetical protein RXV86_05875 [Alisedimentitalea sp. MJ-SS2]|uniref:hypothetical protein n=1 Tax=Aliisedimentitalea sp. MJ-SS2 TaxID=3049795 RepID=UPI0029079585|nr:hypothetical protein [Alisedimentitalea sp. MJ-SS2]MDU8926905.1 hypothetical protein [Alisedimentitalea sp. MJ-SS2]